MKILFISAFYPPHIVGGWEQLVQNINQRLLARGHITDVLTSNYGVNGHAQVEEGVERLLTLESNLVHYDLKQFFVGRRSQLERNLAQAREVITRFEPEVIFIHVMWNLARRIACLAEQLCPGRVVYYMANDWVYAPNTHAAYWLSPAKRKGRSLLKRLLAPLALRLIKREEAAYPLKFEHVMCVSHAVKEELARHSKIKPQNMRVVYNGVDTQRFAPSPSRPLALLSCPAGAPTRRTLSLLYAGSLVPHKGVHTAIEAMALLARHTKLDDLTLTIVGAGHPDYEERLHQLVEREGLHDWISFQPRVTRDKMPQLLRQFDLLIFPSIWEEPLARMTQEAMATGLLVIGTLTGGTGELLIEGQTGLTFAPEDAQALAKQIDKVRHDPAAYTHLISNARQKVVAEFDIRRMIDEIEADLSEVVA
jgi:glycogen(starch) synthase